MNLVHNVKKVKSEDHLGVLDEVVSVSSLNNGINPGVESGEETEGFLDLVGSLGVVPEVGGLLGEEVSTESLVGVEEDSVDIIIELSLDILNKELNLVDSVSLSSLGGRDLLGLLVPNLAGIESISGLNLSNVEAGSEGGGGVVWCMEQILERGGGKVSVLLINLSEDNWGHGSRGLKGSLLGVSLVGNILGNSGSELG